MGNEQKKWTVPKAFLTKTSEFFQKCCNGEWKEASTHKVELPDAEPDAFSTYLLWLYTGELVVTEDERLKDLKKKDREARFEVARLVFRELAALGVFADMLMDSAFENAVVDEIIKTYVATRHSPAPMDCSTIYENISGSHNLKRLVVSFYTAAVSTDFLFENRDNLHGDLVFDIMARLHRAQQDLTGKDDIKAWPTWKRRCEYHTHNDNVPKCT